MNQVFSFGSQHPVRTAQKQAPSLSASRQSSQLLTMGLSNADTVDIRFGELAPKRRAKAEMQSLLGQLRRLNVEDIRSAGPFGRVARIKIDQDMFNEPDYNLYLDFYKGGLVLDSVETRKFRGTPTVNSRRIRYIPTSQGGPVVKVQYYPEWDRAYQYIGEGFRLDPNNPEQRPTITALDGLYELLLPRLNQIAVENGEDPAVSVLWSFLKDLSQLKPTDKVPNKGQNLSYQAYTGSGRIPYRGVPSGIERFSMGGRHYDFYYDEGKSNIKIAPEGHLDDPKNMQPGPFLSIAGRRDTLDFIKRDLAGPHSLHVDNGLADINRQAEGILWELKEKLVEGRQHGHRGDVNYKWEV